MEEVPMSPLSYNQQNGAPEEFTILLKRDSNKRIGLDVDVTDNVTLIVEAVSSGLVEDWNRAHPDKEIRKND